eukprot:7382388-Prymnesium_polylepis.1
MGACSAALRSSCVTLSSAMGCRPTASRRSSSMSSLVLFRFFPPTPCDTISRLVLMRCTIVLSGGSVRERDATFSCKSSRDGSSDVGAVERRQDDTEPTERESSTRACDWAERD